MAHRRPRNIQSRSRAGSHASVCSMHMAMFVRALRHFHGGWVGSSSLIRSLLTLLGPRSRFGDNGGQTTWNLSCVSPTRDWSSKTYRYTVMFSRCFNPRKPHVCHNLWERLAICLSEFRCEVVPGAMLFIIMSLTATSLSIKNGA